ncbi:hypothetical protein F2Q69_00054475 [Brassica cretica]|uniref:HTH myb-type domain-containing protein n=1 Tax=Brassica cretica TaxID=69181 RepID=A0A8S9N364_BRACR|nr:hypothetical protein F2Q69_00054475 [Brassica cretica]
MTNPRTKPKLYRDQNLAISQRPEQKESRKLRKHGYSEILYLSIKRYQDQRSWAAIASSLAGRTDNDIKNYWNTNLKKRLKQKGLDPITHKPINPTGFEPVNHKLGSSGSARLLNRVAKKYAVDVNRDLLTGIIIGNSTIIAEDSQNSSDTEHSTSTLLKTVAKPSAPATSPGSFSDDLDVFFSNEEISDMYMNVDNVGLMEELKSILSYAGDIKDSPEYNVSDEMEFLDSWNEEDGLDLENCL